MSSVKLCLFAIVLALVSSCATNNPFVSYKNYITTNTATWNSVEDFKLGGPSARFTEGDPIGFSTGGYVGSFSVVVRYVSDNDYLKYLFDGDQIVEKDSVSIQYGRAAHFASPGLWKNALGNYFPYVEGDYLFCLESGSERVASAPFTVHRTTEAKLREWIDSTLSQEKSKKEALKEYEKSKNQISLPADPLNLFN